MKDRKFVIQARWDEEAKVWYVASSNVPGLATEAKTIERLAKKLAVMVPELIELNGVAPDNVGSVPIELVMPVAACA